MKEYSRTQEAQIGFIESGLSADAMDDDVDRAILEYWTQHGPAFILAYATAIDWRAPFDRPWPVLRWRDTHACCATESPHFERVIK